MRFRCVFCPFFRMFAALLIATVLAGAAGPARAQLPSGDETVSVEELERFIATLEDETERKKFVDQLRAAIAAKKEVQPDEPALPDRVATRFAVSEHQVVSAPGPSTIATGGRGARDGHGGTRGVVVDPDLRGR